MSNQDVDDYLAAVPEPQKSTLEQLRATLVALLPEAEQGIAYGVPCFKVGGKGVAGFAWYTEPLHLPADERVHHGRAGATS